MFQKRCYIPVRALTRPTISFRTPKLRELSNFRDFGKNNELCGEKRDLSKNFPKTFQKLSKTFQKLSKKLSKNFPKTFQKLSKTFQKLSKKLSKNFPKTLVFLVRNVND
jgi:catalase (peroxidase I)